MPPDIHREIQIRIFAFKWRLERAEGNEKSYERNFLMCILRFLRWRKRRRQRFFYVFCVSVARVSLHASDEARLPEAAWLHFERKTQSLRKIKFPTTRPASMQLQPAADGCIAVGGLAIELRLDRCTLVHPLYEVPLPSPSISSLYSRFFRSTQIMQQHLTECSHAAR